MSRRSARPLVVEWRLAIRDSGLDRTAKLVAHTLSTFMDSRGVAWPSQDLLAAGASLSDVAVRKATLRIEAAGFLEVEWSKGRGSHRYRAVLSPTANAVRGSRSSTANLTPANGEPDALNGEPRSPEVVEVEKEVGPLTPVPGGTGRRSPEKRRATKFRTRLEQELREQWDAFDDRTQSELVEWHRQATGHRLTRGDGGSQWLADPLGTETPGRAEWRQCHPEARKPTENEFFRAWLGRRNRAA